MSGVTVRLAGADDYPEIDRLIDEAYAHDYGTDEESRSDPMHSAAFRAREFDVWVAVDDASGELLGSVTTRRAGGPSLHEDFTDSELDLRLLGVSPRARRRGVAGALMSHVVEAAREQGFGAVTLKTAPNMVGAHRLYEKLGFVRHPERDGLWIDGTRLFDLYTYVYPLPD